MERGFSSAQVAQEVVTKNLPEEEQIQLINRLNNYYTTSA